MSLLTNRPWLHDLWEEAQREPEYATTALWENIFAEVFPYHEYNVASQQPPTKDRDDRRRIDLVVRPRNDRGVPRAVLLFMEAKRTGVTADIVDECERQALTACWAYLIDKKMESVWAMTCVGSSTRLWACKRPKEGDYLVPVFPPGQNLGDIREYVEIAERGNEVLECLEYMKANLIPPESIFGSAADAEIAANPSQSQLPSSDIQYSQDSYGMGSTSGAYGTIPGDQFPQSQPSSSSHQYIEDPVYGIEQSADIYAARSGPSSSGPSQGYDVDADQCVRVKILKKKEIKGRKCYQCSKRSEEKHIYIPVDGWSLCKALYNGAIYEVHRYSTSSGVQYLAWTLDPEE